MPDLTVKLQTDCADPGVPEIQTVDVAIAVIIATRLWAVCERQKHHGSNDFYRDIRNRFRSPK